MHRANVKSLVPFVVAVSCAALLLVPTALLGQGRPHREAAVGPLRQLDDAIESLVRRVSPSVVQVLVTAVGSAEAPGRTGVLQQEQVIGSGVIVDSGGFIVTNAHVVSGAERVRVVLAEAGDGEGARPLPGPVLGARVIGFDKATDLALLKVDTTGLPALPFGEATSLRKGAVVFAIGSPAGLTNSVTMGVVSSVAREVDPDHPLVYIQTDAPINPGNSGGALVDAGGTLVGLNTFILTEGGGSEGLGFVVTINTARQLLLEKKSFWGGLEGQLLTNTMADLLNVPNNQNGYLLKTVVKGSPADSWGLKGGTTFATIGGEQVVLGGDILLAVDGVQANSVSNMIKIKDTASAAKSGTPVKVTILRAGRVLDLTVKLP